LRSRARHVVITDCGKLIIASVGKVFVGNFVQNNQMFKLSKLETEHEKKKIHNGNAKIQKPIFSTFTKAPSLIMNK